MKSFLQNNDTEMYSTHNEEKSVTAEITIKNLKNEIYKYIISVSKNLFIEKLDDIANEYNNTHQSTIKMKPGDVKTNTYIDPSKEINNKKSKFKQKYIFEKRYTPNWSEEDFVIKKVKNIVLWTYVTNHLKKKRNSFYEKQLKNTN